MMSRLIGRRFKYYEYQNSKRKGRVGRRGKEDHPQEEAQDGRILIDWICARHSGWKTNVKYFSLLY